jgi:hypothetical protein
LIRSVASSETSSMRNDLIAINMPIPYQYIISRRL